MRGEFTEVDLRASTNARNGLPNGAANCTGILPDVARLLWPRKTSAHWAAAAGVKERMAKYWLSRRYPVSDSGLLAIWSEIQERRGRLSRTLPLQAKTVGRISTRSTA